MTTKLKHNTTKQTTDDSIIYTIHNSSEKLVHKSFTSLFDFLWALQPITDTTNINEYPPAFRQANVHLTNLFKRLHKEKDWTSSSICTQLQELYWNRNTPIPPRTISIRKINGNLQIEFSKTFEATTDQLTIEQNNIDKTKYTAIKACGEGIPEEHSPYNPTKFQQWRYNTGEVQLSIQTTENNTVQVGINNIQPEQPFWYRIYKHLSITGTPYAYATFSLENQTSVIKHMHEDNYTTSI